MSELENFIDKNKADWEKIELPAGHLERFEYRLDRIENSKRYTNIGFWRMAAAITILVAVAISLLIPRWNSTTEVQYGSLTLGEVSTELSDVERYYSSEVAKAYAALGEDATSDTLLAAHFDALKDLNEEYRNLEQELYMSASHQKVIDAMIVNFRLRLELIAEIEHIHTNNTSTKKVQE